MGVILPFSKNTESNSMAEEVRYRRHGFRMNYDLAKPASTPQDLWHHLIRKECFLYWNNTPILSANCNFEAPLMYEDEITITSTITEIHEKSFRIDHTVHRGDVETWRPV
ncbi:hypothetical protein JI721_10395 [Alicyclobacillus cycloheptanicus]|nr:hypothetical protein JI721_10395 [Alicyclobacillus cycloheptanicus]